MNNDIILDAGLLHRLEEIEDWGLRTRAIYQYACAVRDEAGVGYFSTEKFMRFMDRVQQSGIGFKIIVDNNAAWCVEFHWGPYTINGHSLHVQFKTDGSITMFAHNIHKITDKSRGYQLEEIFSLIDKTVPKNVVVLNMPALD